MEMLSSRSHNDWLTPVLWVWVTVAVGLGTLQRHHVISMAAVAKKAVSGRSWGHLVLPHAALVIVMVGQLALLHVLLLMLHFWVLLVHRVNNPLPSLSPRSTLGSFLLLSSEEGIKFLSQHPTQLQLPPNWAESSFLPSRTGCHLRENIPDPVLPSAWFYIPITCVSYTDLEHGAFCSVSYFLTSPPNELFKGKTLGVRLTHQCVSSTQHSAWW